MNPDPALFAKVAFPLADGSFVPARVLHVVELVRGYDPRLDVKWVPRERRLPDDDAVVITERTPDGREVVVMSFADEGELDERVLARLYAADGTRGDVLARIDAHNRAVKALRAKAWDDAREANRDLVASALRSPKQRWRHGGKVYE